ncbi:hypothetical protein AAZX31_03G202900 [Glycine max]
MVRLVCYGIVGIASLGALWAVEINERASRRDFETTFASLLMKWSTPQLWTSCWRGLHPFCLLCIRFLSFVIMLLFLLWDVLKYDSSIFFYYTEWTFILVTIYFALGTIVSAYGCWRFFNKPVIHNGAKAEFLRRDVEETISTNLITSNKLESRYVEEDFQQRAGFWGFVMQTIYQIELITSFNRLTNIVFWVWGVVVPLLQISHLRLSPLMSCMHALNAFFLLLDTALNNLPFPWFRVSYFVLWSCGYVIFQWVIHAFGFKWWPYPFLELNNKWAPIWYLCLAVIHAPCHMACIIWIVRAKNTILPRLFPRAFLS